MGIARRTDTLEAPGAEAYTQVAAQEGLTSEDEAAPATRSSSVVKPGWGAATKKIADTTKTYADDWTPKNGDTLVKFTEDEPFASVGQHWIDEISKGKRSFNCPEDDCALCAIGHSPRALVYFNIIPLIVDGTAVESPAVVALKAGPMLTDIIKRANEDRGGPLSKNYWVIKRWETQKGGQNKVSYGMNVVKGRDLAEDWELDPDTIAAKVQGLDLFDASVITFSPPEDVEDVIRTYLSND